MINSFERDLDPQKAIQTGLEDSVSNWLEEHGLLYIKSASTPFKDGVITVTIKREDFPLDEETVPKQSGYVKPK